MTDSVMTVLGPVPAQELGITLPHEHLFSSLFPEMRRDGVLNDYDLTQAELEPFVRAGGRTIVDCTTVELQRQPKLLRQLATDTGLNIIMGTGHYRDPYLDRLWFDRHDAGAIGELMVQEVVSGVEGGIRAGIIGEIGCHLDHISAAEERSFRAAAYAHLATGLTISTHAVTWPVGTIQLDLLESCGVDPGRVIVGHCDTVPTPGYRLGLASRGAYVQFDTIRGGSLAHQLEARRRGILELADAGHLDRVLLSQDVCAVSMLAVNGGGGYSYLLDTFVPELRKAGLDEAAIRSLLVDNPRRALTGKLH